MAKTTKFFDKIMVAFFLRQSPASTSPNPAFMKKTRKPVSNVHAVSTAILSSSGVIGRRVVLRHSAEPISGMYPPAKTPNRTLRATRVEFGHMNEKTARRDL